MNKDCQHKEKQILENATVLQDNFHVLEYLLVCQCLSLNMCALDPMVGHLKRSLPNPNCVCRFKDMEIMYGKAKTEGDLHFPIHPAPTYQKDGEKKLYHLMYNH